MGQQLPNASGTVLSVEIQASAVSPTVHGTPFPVVCGVDITKGLSLFPYQSLAKPWCSIPMSRPQPHSLLFHTVTPTNTSSPSFPPWGARRQIDGSVRIRAAYLPPTIFLKKRPSRPRLDNRSTERAQKSQNLSESRNLFATDSPLLSDRHRSSPGKPARNQR